MLRLTLVLTLLLAPAAGAATIGYEIDAEGYPLLVLTGDPGEASDLTVALEARGSVVSDAASPVRAGQGCEQVDERTVRCGGSAQPLLRLGDGNDRVRAAADSRLYLYADGGPGDDTLIGGPMSDGLTGGDGADRIEGGGGDDQLVPGAGADTVVGGGDSDRVGAFDGAGPDAPDTIDAEVVSYSGRRAPLRADLAAGTAGADRLTGVYELIGGRGRDVIAGSSRRERLDGGGLHHRAGDTLIGRGGDDELRGTHGRDVLRGGPGDDTLSGMQGPDVYDGGDGNDRLEFPGGSRTDPGVLRCGRGRDLLTVPRRVPQPLDCEGRALDPVDPNLGIHVWLERRGPLVTRITLERPWTGARWCRAAVDLRMARRHVTVGFVGVPSTRGRSRRLAAPLRATAIRGVGFRRAHGCGERLAGTSWRVAAR